MIGYKATRIRECILLAIDHIGPGAYGIPVLHYINQELGPTSIAAIYIQSENLVTDGLVISSSEPGGVERKYKQKRVWTLTPKGIEKVKELKEKKG